MMLTAIKVKLPRFPTTHQPFLFTSATTCMQNYKEGINYQDMNTKLPSVIDGSKDVHLTRVVYKFGRVLG